MAAPCYFLRFSRNPKMAHTRQFLRGGKSGINSRMLLCQDTCKGGAGAVRGLFGVFCMAWKNAALRPPASPYFNYNYVVVYLLG